MNMLILACKQATTATNKQTNNDRHRRSHI